MKTQLRGWKDKPRSISNLWFCAKDTITARPQAHALAGIEAAIMRSINLDRSSGVSKGDLHAAGGPQSMNPLYDTAQ
jgi:hypothetical protein